MDEPIPVLIHDPPRQHLAQWHSHHHAFSQSDDDIYHYHLPSTHSGPINHSPFFHLDAPECDPLCDSNAMVATKRRRSSLQAILVPSFLFPNAASNQQSPSPLSESFDSALEAGTSSRPASPDHGSAPTLAKQRSRAQSTAGARSPTTPSFPSIDNVQMAFPTDGAEVEASSVAGPAAVLASLAPTGSKERQPHTRRRSKTLVEMFRPARASPPPDYLLDDDPFANLTGSPMHISQPLNSYDSLRRHGSRNLSISSAASSSSSIPSLGMSPSTSGTSLSSSISSSSATTPVANLPRSPLYETPPTLPFIAPVSSTAKGPQPPPYTLSAARSPSSPNISLGYPGKSQNITASVPSSPLPHTGSIRATPAHQRPAIRPRPSLPSLNTLARMNVVLSKKVRILCLVPPDAICGVRKGRVGAGLPFEPWDDLPSDDDSGPTTPAAVPARAAPAANGSAPQSLTPLSAPEIVTSPLTPSAPSLPPLQPVAADLPVPSPSHVPSESDSHPARPAQPLLPSEILSLGSAVTSDEFEVIPPKRSASLSTLRPNQERVQPPSYLQEAPIPAVIATPEPRSPLPVIEETVPLSEAALSPPLSGLESSLPAQNSVQFESDVLLPTTSVSAEPSTLPPPASSSSSSSSSSSLDVPTLPTFRPLSDFAPDLPEAQDESTSTPIADHHTSAIVQADEVFFPAEKPHIAVALTEDVEPEMVFARPEDAGEYLGDEFDEFDEGGSYVDDVLDSYHFASRAASEEGHGDPHAAVPPPAVDESEEGSMLLRRPSAGSRLSVVHEEASRLSVSDGGSSRFVAAASYEADNISLAASYYRSPPPPSEGEGSHQHGAQPLAPSLHSMASEYGSPSSSASISRSASFRSYESVTSSDSGSMSRGRFRRRHSDQYDDEEAIEERLNELFEDDADDEDARSRHSGNNRSFRSFGALHGYISAGTSNPSLSSLDLDLEGESEENVMSAESVGHEGDFGMPSYPTETLLLQKDDIGGRSTASSSGRPSLSRTRSSEDDAESDVIHSPTGASFNEIAYGQPRIHEGRYSLRQSATPSYGAHLQEDQRRILQLQLDPPLMSMSMAAVGMIHDPQQASASDAEDAATGEDAVHDHAAKGFGFGFDQFTTEPTAVNGGDTRAYRDEDEREAIAAGDEIDTADIAVDVGGRLTRDARTTMKGTESEANNVIDTDVSLAPAGETSTNSALVHASIASSSLPSPTSSAFSLPASSVVSSVSSPNPPCSPQYSQTEFSQEDHTMSTTATRAMGRSSTSHILSYDDAGSPYGEILQYGVGGMPGSWTSSSRAPEGGSSSYASNGTSAYRKGSSSGGYQGAYSSINNRGYGCGERRGGGGNGGDDEDDEDRRRRKQLANMGHRVDEQAVDHQGSRSRSQSVARAATISHSRANSRSANVSSSTPPTPAFSRAAPAQPNTHFPSASASSSRYVSEEESEDEKESEESSSSDDDVPLAQRIPGALKAQKTIRRQVRQEREQRKKAKASGTEARRERQETLRPAAAGTGSGANGAQGASSSHDAAVAAAAAASAATTWASSPHSRQRTLTMPSNQGLPSQGVSPHDLSRKLQSIQLASPPAHRQHHAPQQQQYTQASDAALLRAKSVSRPSGEYPRPHDASYPQSPVSPAIRSRSIRQPAPFSPTAVTSDVPRVPALRHARSFHRPSTADRTLPNVEPSVPSPVDVEHRVSRSSTRSSAREAPARRSLSTRRPSTSERPMMSSEPLPPMPISLRPSVDNPRKLQKPHPSAEPHPPSTRTSYEADQPNTLSARQPGHMATKSNALVQQRVFVGNLQQFRMVEIGPSTSARDVVALMDGEGALSGWAGSGGWMVFEVAQDFGMERPVRSFELLADVQASWLKDKTVNYFILKLTPMAIPLSRNAIPSSSPMQSGYVEWEAKRGKWSKRWLQLREHSLWLSKRDNGKDQVMICSLSNFDTYQVTRANRAPKPFTFAVKSTDNLSFFENTADYMHTFSCSEKDGNIWMEKILVARSYVLQQERQVLFTGTKAATVPAASGHAPSGATVSRAGTRKNPSTAQRPAQPLVSLPPMYVTAQNNIHTDVFEPGSLLSKQL
ncbi:hypothetical protein D9619_013160 [Psilocybe cf. subviscida]|uniref:PH domain-containing protein n=1 Tax=Psilocybe cf. subviscida TaxID=2480587 RepID=A0A8H5B8F5_9AGAR|nr:hypothetical protein D9619_013160 [Psilocybe cf. subviscida]